MPCLGGTHPTLLGFNPFGIFILRRSGTPRRARANRTWIPQAGKTVTITGKYACGTRGRFLCPTGGKSRHRNGKVRPLARSVRPRETDWGPVARNTVIMTGKDAHYPDLPTRGS